MGFPRVTAGWSSTWRSSMVTSHHAKLRAHVKTHTTWHLLFHRGAIKHSNDEHHSSGLPHANMGSSGAEVSSATAVAHGGMCRSPHSWAAAWQPGLPTHWQQGVGFQYCSDFVLSVVEGMRIGNLTYQFLQVSFRKQKRKLDVSASVPLVFHHPLPPVLQLWFWRGENG